MSKKQNWEPSKKAAVYRQKHPRKPILERLIQAEKAKKDNREKTTK